MLLMANNKEQACVYFLPVYAPGHLISMLEVAKGLLQCNSTSSNSLSIHILLAQPDNPDKSSLISSHLQALQAQNLPIHLHPLPFVEPPRQFDSIEDFVTSHIRLYLPHIKAALSASPSPVSGLVVDMFASDVISVANELNIPFYIYFSSTATFLSLILHLSSPQGKRDPIDFSEVEEEICIPGLTPIPSKSMPAPLLDMKSGSYKCFMYHARRYIEAKGIVVNSNIHIETNAVEALAQGVTDQLAPGTKFPDTYPVGPVISFGKSNMQGHECLQWLDTQPAKSVLFLCFGSLGAFDMSQVRQIAIGLEQSGHRFLWVLRMPTTEFLRGPVDASLEFLPEGFIERTKERGFVWPSWAPQIDILSHQAIGGFVTHCGWNSILESLWFGVPMIPWPLYAEQHLNAFMLVNEMHVAVKLEADRKNKGFVSAVDLEQAIKLLMDPGSEERSRIRVQVEEMMSACRKAVQRGGVSFVHLQKLAGELGKV
ncbi:Glycosyltransferase [Rhynchospora pubera]|uniref:Glycosyltransferase n=1 Tax=Rhynchospora pubera TaxID=906938 RepID=A0AAV8GYB8_9POAL|nr:Glycosyltransferase [Rhynchospora pubera]